MDKDKNPPKKYLSIFTVDNVEVRSLTSKQSVYTIQRLENEWDDYVYVDCSLHFFSVLCNDCNTKPPGERILTLSFKF